MEMDGDIAELLGIHIGDGCISKNERYSEYYLGGDITEEREYHDNWVGPLFNKKIMKPFFNKKVNYKEHPKVGIYGFHIFNKELVKLFEELGIKSGSKINMGIPQYIMKDESLSRRFLRGLFDTDGSIYFNKNKTASNPINNQPVIKLGTVSNILIKDLFKLLNKLGLHPRLKKPYKGKRNKNRVYEIVIYRRADIKFFIEDIEFKNPKHHTKWRVFKKLGYCPPKTTLSQRKAILKNPKPF